MCIRDSLRPAGHNFGYKLSPEWFSECNYAPEIVDPGEGMCPAIINFFILNFFYGRVEWGVVKVVGNLYCSEVCGCSL